MNLNSVWAKLSLSALFAAFLALGSLLALPIPPVPVVLTTLVLPLAAVFLGPWWAGLSVLLFWVLGILGLPVFAGGTSGLGVFFGPTGGFLLGYGLYAVVTGLLADTEKGGWVRNVLAGLAGLVALYLLGLPWLDAVSARIDGLYAAGLAMAWFFVGDLGKLALAISVRRALQPLWAHLKGAA